MVIGHALVAVAFALAGSALAAARVVSLPLVDDSTLVTLDYFAWDPATHRVWVPAGNTGSIIVLDRAANVRTTITGFATAEFELNGRRGRLGPSSVTLGDGVMYVGNRADSSVCVLDAKTLARGACLTLAPRSAGWAAAPDGVVYVGAVREVWVTRGAPPLGIASVDKAITILDASDPRALKLKSRLPLGASAEGYAVDDTRGLFFTNLEETGETVALDVRRHRVASRWKSGCDEARGLAIDRRRGFLFVACSNRVVALDTRRGAIVGEVATGDGLDNIDYSESEELLYAAGSKSATLTVARCNERGELIPLETIPTTRGARGVIAGDARRAFVADPLGGRILEVSNLGVTAP